MDYDFKPGDRVVRINVDNGPFAKCGQEATVVGIVRECGLSYVRVSYHTNGERVEEDWYPSNTGFVSREENTPTPRLASPLPEDSAERKKYPLYSGLLAYFPAALARVAHHSYLGNEKHNPGLPLQHTRHLSTDHKDALLRHLMEGDYEGVAWRALALLQEQAEAEGAPLAPAAR